MPEDAEVAMVLGWRNAQDVVVEEGRSALEQPHQAADAIGFDRRGDVRTVRTGMNKVRRSIQKWRPVLFSTATMAALLIAAGAK